jgi:hypothetical protein
MRDAYDSIDARDRAEAGAALSNYLGNPLTAPKTAPAQERLG